LHHDGAELEATLNEPRKDGWDLVHVWFDQTLHGEKDGHL
jgi:hypothetical protein